MVNSVPLIAVVGMTGAGKSTFINNACNNPTAVEVGHGSESCTKEPRPVNAVVNNQWVTLIDTPGFLDSGRSDVDILFDIATWLKAIYTAGDRLNGIIILVSLEQRRILHTEKRMMCLLFHIIGQENMGNVAIVSNMMNDLDPLTRLERKLARSETADCWGQFGGVKLGEHLNNTQSAHLCIGMLMDREKMALKIQTELAEPNSHLQNTSAGRYLWNSLGQEIASLRGPIHQDPSLADETPQNRHAAPNRVAPQASPTQHNQLPTQNGAYVQSGSIGMPYYTAPPLHPTPTSTVTPRPASNASPPTWEENQRRLPYPERPNLGRNRPNRNAYGRTNSPALQRTIAAIPSSAGDSRSRASQHRETHGQSGLNETPVLEESNRAEKIKDLEAQLDKLYHKNINKSDVKATAKKWTASFDDVLEDTNRAVQMVGHGVLAVAQIESMCRPM